MWVFQDSNRYVESHPKALPHLQNIQDTVSQVMGITNQQYRLNLPTYLRSDPIPQGPAADVAPRRVRRTRRHNNRGFDLRDEPDTC